MAVGPGAQDLEGVAEGLERDAALEQDAQPVDDFAGQPDWAPNFGLNLTCQSLHRFQSRVSWSGLDRILGFERAVAPRGVRLRPGSELVGTAFSAAQPQLSTPLVSEGPED